MRVDIDFVFRIAALGMLITVLQQVLSRAGREDIATLTALSGLVIALVMVMNLVAEFFSSVRAMFQLY